MLPWQQNQHRTCRVTGVTTGRNSRRGAHLSRGRSACNRRGSPTRRKRLPCRFRLDFRHLRQPRPIPLKKKEKKWRFLFFCLFFSVCYYTGDDVEFGARRAFAYDVLIFFEVFHYHAVDHFGDLALFEFLHEVVVRYRSLDELFRSETSERNRMKTPSYSKGAPAVDRRIKSDDSNTIRLHNTIQYHNSKRSPRAT